jgi:ferredoxin
MPITELSAWAKSLIRQYCATGANTLGNVENDRAFDSPLVGFSRGDDPLYRFFQQDIGSFYLTPLQIFRAVYPGVQAEAGELSVISWVLPLTAVTKDGNAYETLKPTERWARGKLFGEKFNFALRRHVAETLSAAGYPALAPLATPQWKVCQSERYGMSSNWSERHAAYVSGLGTFGLCDGLITARGKAMRCGSAVARIPLPATPRPYSGAHDYCLHFSDGACGQCIRRCPVGAISAAGHDKAKCRAYIHQLTEEHIKPHFGFEVDVCGLCQTGVACSSQIPAKRLRRPAQS